MIMLCLIDALCVSDCLRSASALVLQFKCIYAFIK